MTNALDVGDMKVNDLWKSATSAQADMNRNSADIGNKVIR